MTQIREKILSFGTFRLVPSRQQLCDADQPVRIGSRALGLLQVLLENAGEVVPKDKLIEAVWSGIFVDEANLRANLRTLRKVLGDGHDGRRYIQNVPGRGYRFVEPVYHGETRFGPHETKGDTPDGKPPDSVRLIGRSEAVQNLSSQLAAHRMVSVVGSGGIGKTSLAAVTVAELWRRSNGRAALFVDLTTVKDADQPMGGGCGSGLRCGFDFQSAGHTVLLIATVA